MEGSQQFNLRWNNHTNNIIQVFLEHFSAELLVDVTLSCQGHFLKAHKMILSACSPYFQNLFRNHVTKHPVIILNGIKYDDLQMIIKFMYYGEVKVQETQLQDLLATAETLQIKGLSNIRDISNDEDVISPVAEKPYAEYEKDKSENAVTATMSTFHNPANDLVENGTMPEPPRIRKRKKVLRKINELADKTVYTNVRSGCISTDESMEKPTAQNQWSSSLKIELPSIEEENKDEPINPSSSETMETKNEQPKPRQRSVKAKEKKKIIGRIPRPANAFMLFANEWRKKVAFEYPGDTNTEISVRLGIMWKSLNSQGKEPYFLLAKKVDEEHKRKYPNYSYSPKEARLRKNLKRGLILA
ncbi:longitudinals lacking protein, isoforms H/M/V [Orussus abietinus]|uniref:longitudinals lacking protein, isoforms H/M/V n=1 Tax=Orussus abietinus TaxID=222816 RepID=UPI000626EC51|nr:longitudinals lacking protein, isoforms H/M/V [Orussus abietinus]